MELRDWTFKATIILNSCMQTSVYWVCVHVCAHTVIRFSNVCSTMNILLLLLVQREASKYIPPPNMIRVIISKTTRRATRIACIEVIRNTYNILAGKSEGKIPFRRSRRKNRDNIKINIRRIG
jgi:hypothetical protein